MTIGDIVRRKGTDMQYEIVAVWNNQPRPSRIRVRPLVSLSMRQLMSGSWDRAEKYELAQTVEERVAQELMR
jgi:hypothetical protein